MNEGNSEAYRAFKETQAWLESLKKPAWTPPTRMVQQVWRVLYIIIAVSYGAVFLMAVNQQLPWIILMPFALNLVFNFAYSSIEFGMHNNLLAAIDVMAAVGTLIWALVIIWPYAPWVSLVNIPYLLWCSFVLVLQWAITLLNLHTARPHHPAH
jgi:tryptophan-rich sensory protein